jgi:hypothetical protein
VAASEDGNFQIKLVVKDPQARRLSNPEVMTKHPAQTEQSSFKHRTNISRKIICQGSPGPGIVRQIRSP